MEPSNSKKNPSILVGMIEDNQLIRESVSKLIDHHPKMEMSYATDSVEFFIKHFTAQPEQKLDVLLLDIGLPGMSGLEGISILSKLLPELDIVMLTTYDDQETVQKALEQGAISYISKKSSLKEIIECIEIVHSGGSYMSPMIARNMFNQFSKKTAAKKPNLLTERQLDILEQLAEGKSYRAISEDLIISIETVRSHIKRMYRVLHVSNKTGAIKKLLSGDI